MNHAVHVNYQLQGLPPEWEKLIKENGIEREAAKENLPTLQRVIEFNDKMQEGNSSLVPLQEDQSLNLDDFIINEDPNMLYVNEKKIGEGGVATVYSAEEARTNRKVKL